VAEFNARDISTVIWAFGTLQYKPDEALLDDIATAAHARLDEFEPQVYIVAGLHLALAPAHAVKGTMTLD